MYLYATNPWIKDYAKYKLLVKKCEQTGTKYFKDPKAFTSYQNDIKDVYPNNNDYNPNEKT